ncbi:MAG: hypothetical protein Q4D92_05045 [Slackia sp.]|nr:hypothetical protein [Slackia sp.]
MIQCMLFSLYSWRFRQEKKESDQRDMLIVLGMLAGALGFAPLFLSLRLSRRSTSTQALTVGLYGLAGVAVSMVVLIACLIACAMLARDGLVAFVAAEAAVFLVSTIAYVVYKNVFAVRKRK